MSSAATPDPGPPPARQVRLNPTVLALLIGTLITQIEINVVGIAMPDISAELHNFSLYPWVFAGYLVSYTATVPLFGMLNDVFGRKAAYLTAIALIVGGSLVCGSATSMEVLIAGRLIQGSGGGAMFVTGQTILADLFAVEQRARLQSAFSLISAIGATTGPALGGWIVTYASWRWVFVVVVPVAVLVSGLFLYGFVDSTRRGGQPVNWRGGALLTLILGALLVGIGKGDVNPWLLALAAGLAIPFFLFERRAARPVLPPELFKNHAFRLSAITLFFIGAVQVSFMAFLPLYLQGVAGLPPSTSGYLQSVPMNVAATASTFFLGKVIVRRGYRVPVRIGTFFALLVTVTAAVAAWYHSDHPGSLIPLVLLLFSQLSLGICWGFATSSVMIFVQNQVGQAQRGTATASVHLVRGLGNALAPAVLGYMLLNALRAQDLGLAPEQFLNQKALASLRQLDAAGLAAARAGLGAALRSVLPVVIGVGAMAFLTSLFFPKAVVAVQSKRPS